ncbi:MAG: hypothetical protein JW818_09780 [Pirellulales bacterium]|nr:hypothetical protein [Pirellulales bacterium]
MPDILLNPDFDDQKLLAQVVEYYHRTFKETAEGLDYLRGRGVTVGEAIDRFRIGYANRTLGLKLPSMDSKAGRDMRGRLQQVGLFRNSGHEHMNGCVVFPIHAADGSGRIVDLYGRKTRNDLRRGTPLHMHLSEERRGVWNVEAFCAGNEIIVCSSLLDALTFWNAGYRNVTCTFSADALTDDHMTAFCEFGIRRVLVTAEEIAPRLLAAGIDCFHILLPPDTDVNAYALRADDPSEALGALIRRAAWLGKGQEAVPATVPTMPASKIEHDEIEDPGELSDEEQDDLDDDWEELEEVESVASDEPEPPAHSSPILTASPVPPAPPEIDADMDSDEVTMHLGHRRYRIRGLSKNLAFDQLKVNVLASTETGMFVDTFDLYIARHRRQFVSQAAVELGVEEQTVKKDLGRVLLKLEELQDEQITSMLQPNEPAPPMTPEEKEAALGFLRSPNLLDRIVADFDVVGETTNKLVGYLAAVSRKLDQPLAVIIQSTSAAGKTALMDGILSFVPPEDRVQYSAMTGQSLFYMGETDLKHKILAIVEEEGAERASYALKLLQSEGSLTIASTGKDSTTGRMTTQEYRVQGPVALCLTTTSVTIDEELLNRCLVLTVDENREQTRAIHQFQRRRQTLEGLLANQGRKDTLTLHRNAQRLLRPLLVANPFAESLTFLDDKTRTRRDHLKYLTLIRAIALLHQYQRPVKTTVHQDQTVEYIEVALDDIAVANRLACEVLGRSVDELPPQTRRLLGLVDEMVTAACQQKGIDRADYRFSRRDVREFTGWGNTQLKVHLKRLQELEYLLVHRGGRGQSFVYELLYESPPDAQQKFLARLIDVDQLKAKYDDTGRATPCNARGNKSGGGRGRVGVKSAPSRGRDIDASADDESTLPSSIAEVDRNANLDAKSLVTS